MAKLVEAYGNDILGFPLINLDLIQYFDPMKDAKGNRAYICRGSDGERVGIVAARFVDTDDSIIIPDTTKTILVSFYLNEDGSRVEVIRFPVIAWKLSSDNGSEPIICESLPEEWCLELPRFRDGDSSTWVFPEDCTCSTWEEAMNYAYNMLKAREERIKAKREKDKSNG